MNNIGITALRISLLLLGLLYLLVGLNEVQAGLPLSSLPLSDAQIQHLSIDSDFLVSDNNYRFFGGVFAGLAIILVLAAINLKKFITPAAFALGAIVFGGLTRVYPMNADVLRHPTVVIALMFEIVLGLALIFWMLRVSKKLNEFD